MRALVIYTPEKPVDVVEVPDSASVLELSILTQRLDSAGVEYELLAVSRNASASELAADVERFVDEADVTASVRGAREDLCDECGEPWPVHGDECSMHPDNLWSAPDAM